MFPGRYFPARYWAAVYWAEVGSGTGPVLRDITVTVGPGQTRWTTGTGHVGWTVGEGRK